MTAVKDKQRPPKAGRKPKSPEEVQRIDRLLAEAAALKSIASYFRGLPLPPEANIADKRYIDMCVDSDICSAVDMAYETMREKGILQSSCGDGTIGEDVRFVIRLLKDIRAKCIPQEFSAGIMLMHLELVEGMSF